MFEELIVFENSVYRNPIIQIRWELRALNLLKFWRFIDILEEWVWTPDLLFSIHLEDVKIVIQDILRSGFTKMEHEAHLDTIFTELDLAGDDVDESEWSTSGCSGGLENLGNLGDQFRALQGIGGELFNASDFSCATCMLQ